MEALRCLIRELGKLRSTQRVDQSKDWPLQSQLRIDFGLRLLLAEFEALEFSGGGFSRLCARRQSSVARRRGAGSARIPFLIRGRLRAWPGRLRRRAR